MKGRERTGEGDTLANLGQAREGVPAWVRAVADLSSSHVDWLPYQSSNREKVRAGEDPKNQGNVHREAPLPAHLEGLLQTKVCTRSHQTAHGAWLGGNASEYAASSLLA